MSEIQTLEPNKSCASVRLLPLSSSGIVWNQLKIQDWCGSGSDKYMTHVFMAESRGFNLLPSIPHFILTCFFVLFPLLYNLVSLCPCLTQLYLTIHPSLPPSISSLDLAWYVFICLSHLIHPSAPDLLLLPSIPLFISCYILSCPSLASSLL